MREIRLIYCAPSISDTAIVHCSSSTWFHRPRLRKNPRGHDNSVHPSGSGPRPELLNTRSIKGLIDWELVIVKYVEIINGESAMVDIVRPDKSLQVWYMCAVLVWRWSGGRRHCHLSQPWYFAAPAYLSCFFISRTGSPGENDHFLGLMTLGVRPDRNVARTRTRRTPLARCDRFFSSRKRTARFSDHSKQMFTAVKPECKIT